MRQRNVDRSPEQVLRALRALGGEGTLGDLAAVTGLSNTDLQSSIDVLIGTERAHVRVREGGDLTFHVGDGPGAPVPVGARRASLTQLRRAITDRKTLRVIREREGVLSLAELVEQTGLSLERAGVEMQRLAARWGGERHIGLDGHDVFAFPELMPSVHGELAGREPRPAWVREEDPMDHARLRRRVARLGVATLGVGAAAALSAAAALLGASLGPAIAAATVLAGLGLVVVGAGLILGNHPRFRFRQQHALRRYALGHVVETSLRGKGVVSLDRTVRALQRRAGKRRVSRRGVESALRELAAEFDAPITSQGGDLFFGFRNVKRQFLASHVLRRELTLARRVTGDTVFDTADGPSVAEARELEAFDRALAAAPAPPRTREHGATGMR